MLRAPSLRISKYFLICPRIMPYLVKPFNTVLNCYLDYSWHYLSLPTTGKNYFTYFNIASRKLLRCFSNANCWDVFSSMFPCLQINTDTELQSLVFNGLSNDRNNIYNQRSALMIWVRHWSISAIPHYAEKSSPTEYHYRRLDHTWRTNSSQ